MWRYKTPIELDFGRSFLSYFSEDTVLLIISILYIYDRGRCNLSDSFNTVVELAVDFKLTAEELQKLSKMTNKLYNKFKRDILRDDSERYNYYVITLLKSLTLIDEDTLCSCNFVIGTNKKTSRLCEQLLYELYDYLKVVLNSVDLSSESTVKNLAINYGFIKSRKRALECQTAELLFINMFDAISKVKACLYKYHKKISFTEQELYDFTKNYFSTVSGTFNDYNYGRGLEVFMLVLLCIATLRNIELPMHLSTGSLYFNIDLEHVDKHLEKLLSGIKVLAFPAFYYTCRDISEIMHGIILNAGYLVYRLSTLELDSMEFFCHKHRFPFTVKTLLPDVNNSLMVLCSRLQVRETLLPAQGVKYSSTVVNPFGRDDEELEVEVTYYLKEIFSKNKELYLYIRLSDGTRSRYYIYSPTDMRIIYHPYIFNIDRYSMVLDDCFAVAMLVYDTALRAVSSIREKEQDSSMEDSPSISKLGSASEGRVYIEWHTRNLPRGHKVSEQALSNAKRVGLKLPTNKTLVTGFERSVVGNVGVQEPIDLRGLTKNSKGGGIWEK